MTKPALIGSAPDSWGVWYADDPVQVPWERFLDEVAGAGYTRIELGPVRLPADRSRRSSREELEKRGLTVTAGTIFEHLHRKDSWDSTWAGVSAAAELTAAMGAKHLVVIPDFWRDPATGEVLEPSELTAEEWPAYAAQINRLARAIRDDYGLQIQFHPHADSHVDTHANVERFLAETDPDLVTLCLDTGHIAYCEGDNLKLIQDYPERIGYVHLKQVDPQVMAKVRAEEIGFGEAVKLGAMCEPPQGRAADGADPRRAGRARPRRAVRDRRAGPLPLRARRTAADRHPHPRLPAWPADRSPDPKGTTMSQTVSSEPAGPLRVGVDRRRDDGRRPCRAAGQPGRQRHPGGGRRPGPGARRAAGRPVPRRAGVRRPARPDRATTASTRCSSPRPGFVHTEQLLACIEAGKYTLCEKPLTMDAESSLQVLEAERAARPAADPGRLHAPVRPRVRRDEGAARLRRAREAAAAAQRAPQQGRPGHRSAPR